MPPVSVVVTLALTPAVVAFLVLGFRDPLRRLLPAYALIIPFGSGLAVPLPIPREYRSLSSLLGVTLTLALAVALLRPGTAVRRIPPTVPVWLIFLGVVGLTVHWSVNKEESANSLLVMASLVILYVLLALSPVDRAVVRRLELWLVLGGVAAAVYALYLVANGTLPVGDGGGGRFGRDLLGANHTAAALVLPFALALNRSLTSSGRSARAGWAGAGLLILLTIVFTGSRGGLMAAVAAFVVVALQARPKRVVVSYGLVVGLVLGIFLTFTPGGIGARQAGGDTSGRTEIWKVGIAACQDYCLAGSGWGTFAKVYAERQPSVVEAKILRRGAFYEPHNVWLLVAVEAGLVALGLLGVALVLTLGEAWRLPAGVRAGAMAAVVGMLVTAFLLSNLEFKYFWMTLAYVTLARNAFAAADDRVHGAARPGGGLLPAGAGPAGGRVAAAYPERNVLVNDVITARRAEIVAYPGRSGRGGVP